MTDQTPADLASSSHQEPPTAPVSPPAPRRVPISRRPAVVRYSAGLLSAIIPGLGHVAVRRPRRAALFVGPVVIAAVLVGTLVITQGTLSLGIRLADPDVLGGILALQVVLLAWRLAAVALVLADGRFPRFGRRDALPVVLLAAFVIVPQAGLGYLTTVAIEEENHIFHPVGDAADPFPIFNDESPDPTEGSLAPGSPSPSPTEGPQRINVLLLGEDSGVGRNTALTDTMIVASLDPLGKTVSMISIPRDMVDVPLARGGTFSAKINGLAAWVRWHPGDFPGYKGNGQAVLAGALGKLLGIRIDYYAQVNLQGFVNVVDSVNGIDVFVDHALCDPNYDEYGYEGRYFSIGAGRHHLRGQAALAYARIRKSAGESDFTRAARQQQVLVALRDRLVAGGFLDNPVGFMRALGETIQTNIPVKKLPDFVPFVNQINRKHVYQAVIKYPLVHPGYDHRGSIQVPDLKQIKVLAASLFTAPGTDPVAKYAVPAPTSTAKGPAAAAPSCAVPHTPKATPKPTPKPTKKPTPSPSPSKSPEQSPIASPSEETSAAPS